MDRKFDPPRSHTLVEIDYEIISTVILFPSTESFKKGFCQLQAKVCERCMLVVPVFVVLTYQRLLLLLTMFTVKI